MSYTCCKKLHKLFLRCAESSTVAETSADRPPGDVCKTIRRNFRTAENGPPAAAYLRRRPRPESRNRGRRLTPRASEIKRARSIPTPGGVSFCFFHDSNHQPLSTTAARNARRTEVRCFIYLSSGFSALNVSAAAAPPRKSATRKIQILAALDIPITVMPSAIAGLKAPPEIAPAE